MQWTAQGQREWGWKIAFYLFIAGVGAGGYAVGMGASLFGPAGLSVARAGVVLGLPLLLLGSLVLVADLGVKARAWRAFLNPSSSWIARGTIILSGFMLVAGLHLASWLWPLASLSPSSPVWSGLAAAGFVLAILTMIYTGVLLGASRAIALWSTAILPVLFLVSGLSTGSMGATLVLLAGGGGARPAEALHLLARTDAVLILVEALVLFFYVQATHRLEESRAAARLLTKGPLRGRFWFGVVFLGLVVPFAAAVAEMAAGAAAAPVLWLGALCGLTGGLLLRHVVLAAGAKGPLRAAGIEYSLPTGIETGFVARRS